MSRFPRRIDETDERILSCLRRNGRTPLTALARQIGLSRGGTQDRLRRLEQDGVILGYTVRLRRDCEASLNAWLAITLEPGVTCAGVVPPMLERHDIVNCYSLAGSLDLLAFVQAASPAALSDLRDYVAGIDGVKSVQTFAVLAEHLSAGQCPSH